jgi:adenosylhomocysteine nucleosidase
MSTIAVLCAMDKELERFIQIFKAEEVCPKERIYKTKIANNDVICAVCGIGKVNSALTAQKLIDRFSPDVMINCGVAGGLDRSLSVLDTVIVEKAQYHDFSPLSLLEEDPNLRTSVFECDKRLVSLALDTCKKLSEQGKMGNYILGKVVSGDCFVESDEMSRRLREEFGGSCVEMEGASIAHVCLVNGVRFLIIRSISDFADDSAEFSYDTFVNRAAEQAVEVLGGLIAEI